MKIVRSQWYAVCTMHHFGNRKATTFKICNNFRAEFTERKRKLKVDQNSDTQIKKSQILKMKRNIQALRFFKGFSIPLSNFQVNQFQSIYSIFKIFSYRSAQIARSTSACLYLYMCIVHTCRFAAASYFQTFQIRPLAIGCDCYRLDALHEKRGPTVKRALNDTSMSQYSSHFQLLPQQQRKLFLLYEDKATKKKELELSRGIVLFIKQNQ